MKPTDEMAFMKAMMADWGRRGHVAGQADAGCEWESELMWSLRGRSGRPPKVSAATRPQGVRRHHADIRKKRTLDGDRLRVRPSRTGTDVELSGDVAATAKTWATPPRKNQATSIGMSETSELVVGNPTNWSTRLDRTQRVVDRTTGHEGNETQKSTFQGRTARRFCLVFPQEQVPPRLSGAPQKRGAT